MPKDVQEPAVLWSGAVAIEAGETIWSQLPTRVPVVR
jgi:hypothetical protein